MRAHASSWVSLALQVLLFCSSLATAEQRPAKPDPPTTSPRYLGFETCGGLTNQRLALLQGLLMAKASNRTAILPKMHSSYSEAVSTTVDMSYFYDVRASVEKLGEHLPVVETSPGPADKRVEKKKLPRSASQSQVMLNSPPYQASRVVEFECPLFAYPVKTHPETTLFWNLNDALLPSPQVLSYAQYIMANLQRDGSSFVAVHVRAEQDWIEHCEKWENIRDSIIRDNCMSNTEYLTRVLRQNKIVPGTTVYLAGGYRKSDVHANPLLRPLLDEYNVVTKDDLVDRVGEGELLRNREFFAAIDYYICENAPIFVGNSVSTFSAMLLLSRERRRALHHENLEHFHYNGGDIPLLGYVSLDVPYNANQRWPLKWIFAYTSMQTDYDELLKVAVLSAIENTTLQPVCLFYGPRTAIADWLESHGVIVILHRPAWEAKVYSARQYLRAHISASPLYMSPTRMIATFLRVDIPILGFADDYVLYTDIDVLFMKDVKLSDFGPRPEYFTLGVESKGSENMYHGRPYGNAGVMLLNLVNLRRSYKQFVNYIFSKHNLKGGLHFGDYGPGDQGAYQKFYAGKFSVVKWPVFNWKPYWNLPNVAKIIHFHGPKPADYHRYLRDNTTGNAMFDNLLKSSECHNEFSHCRQAIDLFDHFTAMAARERGHANTRPLADDDNIGDQFKESGGNERPESDGSSNNKNNKKRRHVRHESKVPFALSQSALAGIPLSEVQSIYALIAVVGMLWTILLVSGRRAREMSQVAQKYMNGDKSRAHAA